VGGRSLRVGSGWGLAVHIMASFFSVVHTFSFLE